jgi:hypothetical protein
MPGQPDWQRFQTSAGPLIYKSQSNPNNQFSNIYVGAWRSLFFSVSIEDPNALVNMTLQWAEDAQGLQPLVNQPLTVGNNTFYFRQIAILARYLSLSTNVLIGGSTNNVSMWVGPSLLEPFPMQFHDPYPQIALVNQSIGAGATTSFHPNHLGGGKKKLAIWPANASCRVNIRYFDAAGVLQYLAVLSELTANAQNEFEFTAPDGPYSIDVTNLGSAAVTLHVFLYNFD